MKNYVLIIDHDKETCKDIKYQLVSETVDAYYCLTLQDGLTELTKKDYAAVILNISFPESDGMELLQTLRQLTPMPIMLLSTSTALADKVQAFHLGADDYLIKPFETEECLARVYAMLRRVSEMAPLEKRAYAVVSHGSLVMKKENRLVLRDGLPMHLTYREYELLSLFMAHPERVYTFSQLYEQVWAEEYIGNRNSVVCEVKRLRKKLGDNSLIENVREVGYRFRKK